MRHGSEGRGVVGAGEGGDWSGASLTSTDMDSDPTWSHVKYVLPPFLMEKERSLSPFLHVVQALAAMLLWRKSSDSEI